MIKKSLPSKSSAIRHKAEDGPPRAGRRLRHRVMVAGKFVFGPGKADVLEAIQKTGSLAAAARSMGMSYMRAWRLVQEMHCTYAKPLVELKRGGKAQGGAVLTDVGEKALLLYRRMEFDALSATEGTWLEFCDLLDPKLRDKKKTGKQRRIPS